MIDTSEEWKEERTGEGEESEETDKERGRERT